MSSVPKVWFITGSSSGFGLASTELVLQRGDKVVATLRKPTVLADLVSKYPDTLLLLKLDVTQPEEVKLTFATARERFGRIDVVLSNAGYGIVSEIEGTSEKNARGLFETNFWGASYVCREAVRFFREENQPVGGRLIQVSSVSGVASNPGSAWYCASKFAIEALAEALVVEVSPNWNIKVTIVEPGPFRTNCPTTNMVIEPIHPAYSDPALPSMRTRNMVSNPNTTFTGDATKFAEAIYKLVYLEDPPLRLPLHHFAVEAVRRKGRHLIDTADTWASWSEDMYVKE
ncbi:hypothetical protein F5J12DRAFT_299795 [Pisolithus orientalis]|uniref:uncharacterized protein n=1 Tax=Pisolithus orientalis TaxID=936130 RepID=UPI0022246239|nr:uncharacterized protein F5J12DRAFT_299795 [Pisolithus orientalis]KAI6030593.1 hypothetical protein F5J12DRAFT_299795 [Pisolithus orientalis]